MTQTHTLTTVRNLSLAFVFCAIALGVFAQSAHAQSAATTTATSTPEQLEREVRTFLGNSLHNRNINSIQERIRQVERRIVEMRRQLSAYETLLAQLRARASSTASTTAPTPSPAQGSFRVLSPNGGVVYKDRTGAVVINWANGVGATSISLGLETASGTTSIVEDLSVVATSTPTSAWSRAGRPITRYVWTNAPVGTGYKIVLTGEKGTATYTDKSDHSFAVRARIGSGGSVQGASTMSLAEVLTQLEQVLKGMSR